MVERYLCVAVRVTLVKCMTALQRSVVPRHCRRPIESSETN
jgi:hypothetical protein